MFVLRTLCTDPLEGAFASPFRLTGAVSVTLARRENVPGCMDQPKEAESSLLLPSDDGDNDDDESESDGCEFDDGGDDDDDDDDESSVVRTRAKNERRRKREREKDSRITRGELYE